jgi:hypothetical protein
MRIHPIFYSVAVLTVFFGIILGFQAAGVWSTSGKITAGGDPVQPSAADVNSIKGWMTLEQIATAYNVPLADILSQFELPGDTPPTTAISSLESDLFSVTNLRTWLQNRSQPPEMSPTPEANAGQMAAAAPAESATMTLTTLATSTAVIQAPTQKVAPEKTITGKTTFQEVLDWGVPQETIEAVIGGAIPPGSTVIKDYVTSKGLAFTTTKAQLQVEVDKTK